MDFGEEESIYHLISPAVALQTKGKMHRSKHNPNVPPSYSTFGVAGTARTVANASGKELIAPHHSRSAMTVGATNPNVAVSSGATDPKRFLRKGASVGNTVPLVDERMGFPSQPFKRPEITEGVEGYCLGKKASVPLRSDKPIMGLKSEKNFVVSNAVESILSVPKNKNVENEYSTIGGMGSGVKSGAAVSKTTYGKVPGYLTKVKHELRAQQECMEAAQAEAERLTKEERLHKLSPEEVQELKDGLKRRWDVCNKAFQTMSFSMETSTQIKKKDDLEKEIKVLEESMKKLNKRFLFVYDDLS